MTETELIIDLVAFCGIIGLFYTWVGYRAFKNSKRNNK